jgi:two-component system sensor histidine kinase UhpB
MQQEGPAERFLEDLASQLRIVRHVRIGVTYASGRSQVVRPVARPVPVIDDDHASLLTRLWSSAWAPAPAWFASLIAPPVETRNVPVVANGLAMGSVQIISEPSDEIGEVWENTVALTGVMMAVNLCVIAFLYILFGRVLQPLRGLASRLGELELRRYRVRLRDRRRASCRHHRQVQCARRALDASRAESAPGDEPDHRAGRRAPRTALDLHDEVGPSLFALKANAESIATASPSPQITGATTKGACAGTARNNRPRTGHQRSILTQLRRWHLATFRSTTSSPSWYAPASAHILKSPSHSPAPVMIASLAI